MSPDTGSLHSQVRIIDVDLPYGQDRVALEELSLCLKPMSRRTRDLPGGSFLGQVPWAAHASALSAARPPLDNLEPPDIPADVN